MKMDRGFAVLAAVALVVGFGLSVSAAPPASKSPEAAVRAVLDAQVAAWNRGDIDAFMEGYSKSPTTRFASGGSVKRGWSTVRDGYKARYDTRAKMGTLTFSELEITNTGPKSAIVFGRWQLAYPDAAPAGGLFTLLFERQSEGWRIVADHTSSN